MRDSSVELSKLTITELVTLYNEAAAGLGLPNVNKFSDKRTAVRRVMQIQDQAERNGVALPSREEAAPTPADLPDGAKVSVKDEEIKVPEPKAKREKVQKEPRVTKAGIIRSLFENSGSMGVGRDELSEKSGHDPKNVGITMQILSNADRTKDPIVFVKVGHTYYRPEFAPKA